MFNYSSNFLNITDSVNLQKKKKAYVGLKAKRAHSLTPSSTPHQLALEERTSLSASGKERDTAERINSQTQSLFILQKLLS